MIPSLVLPLRVDGISPELMVIDRWVCCKVEPRKKSDGEEVGTKVPYDPKTGRKASSTDSGTWATYAQAKAAYLSGAYDAIGFVVSAGDDIVAFDLDQCRDPQTGELLPWAQLIVDTLDSYTTVSMSGTGVRIFARGNLAFDGRNNRKTGIEAYRTNRFLTVTGHLIPGPSCAIEHRQNEIDWLVAENFAEAERPSAPSNPALSMSDEQLLERAFASRNGEKIRRLYAGDTSGYGSLSEADLAFCSGIAFWNADEAQIDRTIRSSGLYRAKWERPDYRARTIAKAMQGEKYSGRGASYVPPAGRDDDDDELGGGFNLTDMGNAERFEDQHGNSMLYSFPQRSWYAWSGSHWQIDQTGIAPTKAKETVRSIYSEAASEADTKQREVIAKHAVRSEQAQRVVALLGLAQSSCSVDFKRFDADPWALNVRNGTVDLRTGILREHRRGDYLTKCAPVEFDPDASAPNWEAFLLSIMSGDADLVAFLQRQLGYSITGITREEIFVVYYGEGSNGKSTLLKTIKALLDPYCWTASPELLLSSRFDASKEKELFELRGRRIVTAIETGEGRALNEAIVKSASGGDELRGRALYQDAITFQPTHHLILATNHRPNVKGEDHGIWRRIHLVPFKRRFWRADDPKRPANVDAEDLIDPRLGEKLAAEGPGILNWLVRGCLAWQENGLGVPASVWQATDEYRVEEDTIGRFLDERCSRTPNAQIATKALYMAYADWCKESREEPKTQNAFSRSMTARGFDSTRTTKLRSWIGITFGNQNAAESEPEPTGGDANDGFHSNSETFSMFGSHEEVSKTETNASFASLGPTNVQPLRLCVTCRGELEPERLEECRACSRRKIDALGIDLVGSDRWTA